MVAVVSPPAFSCEYTTHSIQALLSALFYQVPTLFVYRGSRISSPNSALNPRRKLLLGYGLVDIFVRTQEKEMVQ